MTNVRARGGRIAILHDELRVALHFRARLSEIDDVRNTLIAHAAIGSHEKHVSSKEHAL